jgi:HD superfamily phosphohydrolase
MDKKKYIYDPLYGVIYLPELVWDFLPIPELQRLREVRLCNINSLCLIGGANINRYEHAIGTCYLAIESISHWSPLSCMSDSEYRQVVLAALLHDIMSGAFGHSVEYIESREGFSHESAFEQFILGIYKDKYQYKSIKSQPVFFGMDIKLGDKLSEDEIRKIGEVISGTGKFGALLNGDLDLDNLDNVFRLAFHIGIVRDVSVPLRLARALAIKNGQLTVSDNAIPLVEEWQRIRKRLYELLLLNPQEFAAKCMLSEAIEMAKETKVQSFSWNDVDFELLKKLSEVSSESNVIIKRLVSGDLYGCVGIYSSQKTDMYDVFCDTSKRREFEKKIGSELKALSIARLQQDRKSVV